MVEHPRRRHSSDTEYFYTDSVCQLEKCFKQPYTDTEHIYTDNATAVDTVIHMIHGCKYCHSYNSNSTEMFVFSHAHIGVVSPFFTDAEIHLKQNCLWVTSHTQVLTDQRVTKVCVYMSRDIIPKETTSTGFLAFPDDFRYYRYLRTSSENNVIL
jgi:hypothetical protein